MEGDIECILEKQSGNVWRFVRLRIGTSGGLF